MGELIMVLAGITGGTAIMLSPVLIVRMVLKHREKMESMKYPREGSAPGAPGVLEAISELRREMATLRDTTTKFDMSFDAALARVENRLDRVEQEHIHKHTVTAATNEEQATVILGHR